MVAQHNTILVHLVRAATSSHLSPDNARLPHEDDERDGSTVELGALNEVADVEGADPVRHGLVMDNILVYMSRGTYLMRERQLRFCGHVVRFPMDDPAYRILNAKAPAECNRRRGRPNLLWLAQLGDQMKNWSMGLAQPLGGRLE